MLQCLPTAYRTVGQLLHLLHRDKHAVQLLPISDSHWKLQWYWWRSCAQPTLFFVLGFWLMLLSPCISIFSHYDPKPSKSPPPAFHLQMNGAIICLFTPAIVFPKLLWQLTDYLLGLTKGRLGWKIRGQGEGKSLSSLSIPSLIFILFPAPSLSNTPWSCHRQCLLYVITPIRQHHWHHSPLF